MTCRIQRTDDYLAHHGVDGQKWGVRRYQNEDGSYKPGAEGRYDPEPEGNGGRRKGSKTEELGRKIKNSKIVGEGSAVNKVGSKLAWGIVKMNSLKAKRKKYHDDKRAQEKAEWEETKKQIGDAVKRDKEHAAQLKAKHDKYHADKRAQEKAEWEAGRKREAEKAERKKAEKEAKQAQRKAKWEAAKANAERKHLERQAKNDEKASKDSYKKVALRYVGRDIATGLLSGAASYGVYRKTGDMGKAIQTKAAINSVGGIYNTVKGIKEAKRIHDYRKKHAQHSDYSGLELYHGSMGGDYVIFRA